MNKYIYCFIFGLILFLILNSKNGFSIGVPKIEIIDKSSGKILHTFESEFNAENIHTIEEAKQWFITNEIDYLPGTHFINEVVPLPIDDVVPLPIDDSAKFVDLSKIVEDKDATARDNILWNYSRIDRKNLPGCLKYVDGDKETKLKVVDLINTGEYGIVYSYSEETPLPDGWIIETSKSNPKNKHYYNTHSKESKSNRPRRPEDKFKSVAVKVFKDQNDPEIQLIKDINSHRDYNCDTIQSRIINLKFFQNNYKNVALMEIMVGNLKELSTKTTINKQSIKEKNEIYIYILIQLANILKCLFDLNYYYNDLKLQNILFILDNGVHIVLGDIGSITIDEVDSSLSTYPPPEYMYRDKPGVNYVETERDIIWGFGIIILSLYGIHWKWIYHASNYPNSMSEYPEAHKESITKYYSNLTDIVIPGLNITDPKLLQIVNEIFKINRTITIEQILDTLYGCINGKTWSLTGLNPCKPCTPCNDNEVELKACTPTQNRECKAQIDCSTLRLEEECRRAQGCNWNPYDSECF